MVMPVLQTTTTPALYECELTHVRTTPLRHAFTYGTYLWLVDLDEMPRLPCYLRALAGFRAADHFDGTAATIRTAKEFYVSPFFPVDGEYRMRLPQPGERLALTITLRRDGVCGGLPVQPRPKELKGGVG